MSRTITLPLEATDLSPPTLEFTLVHITFDSVQVEHFQVLSNWPHVAFAKNSACPVRLVGDFPLWYVAYLTCLLSTVHICF